MAVLFEIALVIALVVLAASYFLRGRQQAERQEVLERRVEAYIHTIRREGDNRSLAAMGDLELRDLLLSSARNLRVQSERRWYLLLGGGIVTFIAAIIVANQDGTRGFAIALFVGVLALYGLHEFLGRRMREPLREHGIDAERLRVE